MRRFAGIDLGREPVPDETAICKFRHLLGRHEPRSALFAQVHACVSRAARTEAVAGHDRRRDHHPRAEFDEERGSGTRPGGMVHRALPSSQSGDASTAFLALKRDAAPGIDGLTWQDYEADLNSRIGFSYESAGCRTSRSFVILLLRESKQ